MNQTGHIALEWLDDVCCCGHKRREHHGEGQDMCRKCRHACEKFHLVGEDNTIALAMLIISLAASVIVFAAWGAFMAWYH